MPPREEVLYQLATGLEYIHKMGMLHRDIKPENVLIWVNPKKEEEVLMKWADFGLSKRVNERGSFSISEVRGTNHWLAPELLKILMQEEESTEVAEGSTSSSRQRGTVKSDVFAEGLIFGYFYLDGEHIFGNIHSQTDITMNIMKNNPANISSKFPTVKIKSFPVSGFKAYSLFDRDSTNVRSRSHRENVVQRTREKDHFVGGC